MAENENTQIIMTTHSPTIVKMLNFEQIRVVKNENEHNKVVNIDKNSLPYPSLNEINYLAFGVAYNEPWKLGQKYKKNKVGRSYGFFVYLLDLLANSASFLKSQL